MSKLQEALEYIKNYEDVDFKIRSYSGRCMYGKSCLAITGDDVDQIYLGLLIGQWASNHDCFIDIMDDVSDSRQDNMGRGSVIYWPGVPYEEEEEEDDETKEIEFDEF